MLAALNRGGRPQGAPQTWGTGGAQGWGVCSSAEMGELVRSSADSLCRSRHRGSESPWALSEHSEGQAASTCLGRG